MCLSSELRYILQEAGVNLGLSREMQLYFLKYTGSLITSELSLQEKVEKNHSKIPFLVDSINIQLSKNQYQ